MLSTLESDADIARATAALIAAEPRFAAIVERHGLPHLRRAPPGLPGLLRIVTEQVLSLKAAETIWLRLERELPPLDPPAILRRREATLMKLGLSGAKARAFRAIATAVAERTLPLDDFPGFGDAQAQAALLSVGGIGPWTADIYLLSCLGRADIWPAGDLALQLAVRDLFALAGRPTERATITLAEDWRPWRAVAARLLWSHYRALKGMAQAGT